MKPRTLWAALGVGAALVGGYMILRTPRGIRNNNPGNIRGPLNKKDPWQGASLIQTDPDFLQFDSALYGLRAMAKTLKKYYNVHNLTTIRTMISRWAPSNENDTAAYIAFVSDQTGLLADERLSPDRDIPAVMRAMVRYENGRNWRALGGDWYPLALYVQAYGLS